VFAGLLQLLKCVRQWGTVHIYGALQGGGHVAFPVRHTLFSKASILKECR
jgi:hypothetical protein